MPDCLTYLKYADQLPETHIFLFCIYSKTCVKLPLKNRRNKDLNDKWLLNEGRKYGRIGAFCHTFDLHQGIIGLKKRFLVFFESGRFTQVLLYVLSADIDYMGHDPTKPVFGASDKVRFKPACSATETS